MKVRYTRKAECQLRAIFEYIAADNETAARQVITDIRSSLEHLVEFPLLGKQTDIVGVRKFTVTKHAYVALYIIAGSIFIISILQCRQNT